MIATDGFCDHSYEDTYTQVDFSIQCTLYGYVLVLAWIGFRQTLIYLTTGLFHSNPLTLNSRETQVLLTTMAKVLLGFKYGALINMISNTCVTQPFITKSVLFKMP